MNGVTSYVTVSVVFIMIVIGIFYYKYFYKVMNNVLTEVKRINKDIKELQNISGKDSFEDIKHILTKDKGTVANIWQLYEKTLVIRSTENGQNIYSTVSADEYFNITSATAETNVKAWQNTASYLTGLGILGTFGGLSLGLKDLDFSSTDIATLKAGISNLLSGTNTAFLTSLAGMILALGFYFAHNRILGKVNKAISILANSIENLYPRRSIEQVLDEMLIENKKQADQLMDFNESLAMAIGDALNEKINDSMGPIFEKLTEAVERLAQGGTNALSETLQNGIGSGLANFSTTLEALQLTLDKSARAMEQASNDSNNRLELTMDKMSNTLNKLMDDLEGKSQENISTTNSLLKNMTDEINTKMKINMEQMIEASKNANQEFNNNITETAKLITEAADKMRKDGEMSGNSIAGAGDKMRETIEALLANVNESVNKQDQTVSFAISKLETITNSVTEVMSQSGTAAGTFRNAAEVVAKASDSLGTNIVKADEMYNLNSGKISDNMNKLVFSVDALSKVEKTAQQNWQAYENRFKGVSGELEKAFTQLDDGLRQYNNRIVDGTDKVLKEYDNSISEAVKRLGSLIEELGETLDPIVEYMEKNKK